MEPIEAVTSEPAKLSPVQAQIQQLQSALSDYVLGQNELVEQLIIALLTDGHILLEGPPGLAKTRAISGLSQLLVGDFQRTQFTPDLLPGDITGSEIYNSATGQFEFREGPLFCNLLLADEINRAPAKVQSALLEAMAERQVTVAGKTYALPKLFLVMATQNPLEQEGTYPLPEAQLDRFMLHVNVNYPNHQIEKAILQLVRTEQRDQLAGQSTQLEGIISEQEIFQARSEVGEVYMAPNLEDYIVSLVMATRQPEAYSSELANAFQIGASPRASISLDRAVRAKAWLSGRTFVIPQDIQDMLFNILRHRIGLSYQAQAKGLSKDKLIDQILQWVAVP